MARLNLAVLGAGRSLEILSGGKLQRQASCGAAS